MNYAKKVLCVVLAMVTLRVQSVQAFQAAVQTQQDVQIKIPEPMSGQPVQMSYGTILAAAQSIADKYRDNLSQLNAFKAELAGIKAGERPQLEALIRKHLTPQAIAGLKVTEPNFTPDQVEIDNDLTPEQLATWPELVFRTHPVEKGPPFKSVADIAPGADKIRKQIRLMDLPVDHKEAKVKAFDRCIDDPTMSSIWWKTGFCELAKQAKFHKIQQTRGDQRVTTHDVKCTGPACQDADILVFFDEVFGEIAAVAFPCRGNPEIPYQSIKGVFKITHEAPICRAVNGPTVLDKDHPVGRYTVVTDDPSMLTWEWRVNGQVVPETSMTLVLDLNRDKALLREGLNDLFPTSTSRSHFNALNQGYTVSCLARFTVNLPPPPPAQAAPKVVCPTCSIRASADKVRKEKGPLTLWVDIIPAGAELVSSKWMLLGKQLAEGLPAELPPSELPKDNKGNIRPGEYVVTFVGEYKLPSGEICKFTCNFVVKADKEGWNKKWLWSLLALGLLGFFAKGKHKEASIPVTVAPPPNPKPNFPIGSPQ